MAWTSVTIPAAELTASADDKPMLLTHNDLRDYTTLPAWSNDTGPDWASGGVGQANNADVAAFPGYFAHDGHLHLRTFPVGSAVSVFFLLFDLDATNTIDAGGIFNHNFADLAGTVTARLGVADDSAYSVRNGVVSEWTSAGATSQRLVNLSLSDPTGAYSPADLRLSNVSFAYLEVSSTVAFTTSVFPRVGEVYLGRRRQLSRKPNKPGDDRSMQSRQGGFESDSGNHTALVHHTQRRIIAPSWLASSDDTVDDKTAWENIYTDLAGGTEPFVYIADPNASPRIAPMMYFPRPGDIRENVAQTVARISKEMREKKPFERSER